MLFSLVLDRLVWFDPIFLRFSLPYLVLPYFPSGIEFYVVFNDRRSW